MSTKWFRGTNIWEITYSAGNLPFPPILDPNTISIWRALLAPLLIPLQFHFPSLPENINPWPEDLAEYVAPSFIFLQPSLFNFWGTTARTCLLVKSEAMIFHSWVKISFVTSSTNDNLVVTRLNYSQHPAEPKLAKMGHKNRDPKAHSTKQEWLSISKGTTNDLTPHAKLLPQKPKQHEKPRQAREEGRMKFQS